MYPLDIYTFLFLFFMCLEAAKDEGTDDEDGMDEFPSDEDEDDDELDREMGSAEDGDEADSLKLQKLAAQASCGLVS